MDQLRINCRKQERMMEKILIQTEQSLEDVPEGGLWVSSHGNRISYFQTQVSEYSDERINGKKAHGCAKRRYLPKSEQELIRRLAQKDYDLEVRKAAEEELHWLKKLDGHYNPDRIKALYENLHPARKKLVIPAIPTDEQFIEEWKKIDSYFPIGFSERQKQEVLRNRRPRIEYEKTGNLWTDQGDEVDSKSEMIISTKLDKYHIPYKNGCTLYLEGYNNWVAPDFVVLNVRTRKTYIWEHHGMMGTENYAANNVAKLENYEMNGYWPGENLITTYETSGHRISTRLIDEIIKKYLL